MDYPTLRLYVSVVLPILFMSCLSCTCWRSCEGKNLLSGRHKRQLTLSVIDKFPCLIIRTNFICIEDIRRANIEYKGCCHYFVVCAYMEKWQHCFLFHCCFLARKLANSNNLNHHYLGSSLFELYKPISVFLIDGHYDRPNPLRSNNK